MLADCDCCGRKAELTRCWYGELETFACDQCRGFGDSADDYDGIKVFQGVGYAIVLEIFVGLLIAFLFMFFWTHQTVIR